MIEEANEVAPRIWVGKHVKAYARGVRQPTVLVACAHNLQARPRDYRGRLVECPLHDNAFRILDGEVDLAEQTARAVAALVAGTKPVGDELVLFTCREGLNRSAWVAALMLIAMGEPRQTAVAAVKNGRPGSLYNWFFEQHALTGRDPSS